jgi:hypothetical protein
MKKEAVPGIEAPYPGAAGFEEREKWVCIVYIIEKDCPSPETLIQNNQNWMQDRIAPVPRPRASANATNVLMSITIKAQISDHFGGACGNCIRRDHTAICEAWIHAEVNFRRYQESCQYGRPGIQPAS